MKGSQDNVYNTDIAFNAELTAMTGSNVAHTVYLVQTRPLQPFALALIKVYRGQAWSPVSTKMDLVLHPNISQTML